MKTNIHKGAVHEMESLSAKILESIQCQKDSASEGYTLKSITQPNDER